MQSLSHINSDTLSACHIIPTQPHPWTGLCAHFSSWRRPTMPFQNVSHENRALMRCSWMHPKPPDQFLGKHMHSINIVKPVNKEPISVQVILTISVTQTTTLGSPLPSFSTIPSHTGPFPKVSAFHHHLSPLLQPPPQPPARAHFKCYQRAFFFFLLSFFLFFFFFFFKGSTFSIWRFPG